MTATNHMLAGAVLAVGIQSPIIVAPLAVASHFLLDVLPHFGIHKGDHAARNKHPLFRYIVITDALLAVAFVILLPSILQGAVSWWLLIWGMFFAFLPDFVWIRHFFYELRHGKKAERGWLSRLHSKIQWGERPWGVAVEVVWFGGMGVLLGFLAV